MTLPVTPQVLRTPEARFAALADFPYTPHYTDVGGSLIGRRMVAESPDRFARVVLANGGRPTGTTAMPKAFMLWQAFARYSPWFPVGRIVKSGCAAGWWQQRVPGAQGQPHAAIRGAGHFLQEDKGEELAHAIVAFMRRPANR